MSWINVEAEDGTFSAYVARPVSGSGPAVVVVQEIFGVNEDLRATCDELAKLGFIAVSPDLFWRVTPRIEMNRLDEAEWARGFELYKSLDFDRAVRDLAAVVTLARSLEGASGRVGVMGFCLGGLLAFLTGARTDVDAAVSYYGGGTERYVDEARAVTTPMTLHLAGEDEYMPAPAREKIVATLKDRPNTDVFVYPGCAHAFARHKGVHYDQDAARLANARTEAFLARNLG
ncbi:dienelactone hydrolase family protein [Povalibacter sp.]|uniref:dienelactone hydrolase family protein n=1 Tax=Povalibacter sp. TaxID=1962978 RepID=UPI002F42D023